MLTVKIPVLVSKLPGECHADCEDPCVSEQAAWGSVMLTVLLCVLL